MTKKYKNKYRIEPNRLKNWDYRTNGAYFITIYTDNREHFFGEILHEGEEKIMNLSEIGIFAHNFWNEIPKHFPFVELGNFVVMPNHAHGILIIDNKKINGDESLDIESLQCNDCTDKKNDENKYYSDISQNQVRFPQLFVHTNRWFQNIHEKLMQNLIGNLNFMIL